MKSFLLLVFVIFLANGPLAQEEVHSDTLHVYFLYGSKPKKEFKKRQERWFGGILGGHVGIQYDSTRFLSFFFTEKAHVFQHRKKFNSQYELQTDSAFYHIMDEKKRVDSVKTLIIAIPITKEQRIKFNEVCDQYIETTPYDYAVLGMRCASSTYDVLSKIGIVKPMKIRKMWKRILYPKKLRKRLIEKAKRREWRMKRKHGTRQRTWERD